MAGTSYRKTLCLDFDGVLHSYKSGWEGHDTISDLPVPGAMEFLYDALKSFNVAIFSSRSSSPGGVAAMKFWVAKHARVCMFDYGREWWLDLEWPISKPAAHLSIDDRAIQFMGPDSWPSMLEIASFRPWNKV